MMIIYAQLNNDNMVVGISHLSGEVNLHNMIDITDLENKPKLGDSYNPVTNTFIEKEIEEVVQYGIKLTLEEKINDLQNTLDLLLLKQEGLL